MPDIDKSYQELIITNFGLSPSGYTGSIGAVGATGPAGGYTGSRGDAGYVGSAGPGMSMTTDTFTGDGTTTAFVLTTTPDSINRTIVNYNGVTVLRSAYTLSTATITFSSAPAVGSQIEITTINSASGSGGATGTALKITTIGYVGNNTATDTAGGETVTLTGTGFVTGASVIINGVAAGVVTVVSATQLTFTAPALAAGTYIFYVVNTDGATAISVPGISYSGVPSFYVGAGSVGSVYEASSFNSNVAAVGDSAITYTIASGSLPAGATLNANGVITGSSVLTASPTTYTFGVNASDGQNQDVTRSYTITVNPDTVTWSAPTDAATVTLGQGSSTSTSLTAVSAAGKDITYTANALPSGLSIVGGAVTGTPTVLGNTTTVLTATAASTTRTANVTVVWNVVVTNEPYFMYNSLLLSGNGTNLAQNNTFLDSSSNNFAVTRAGNTPQGTFSPYGANWSNYFDGTGDYLTIPSTIALCPQNGQYTLEFWTYVTSAGSYGTFFFTDVTGGFILSYNNSSPLQLTVGVQNTSLDILATVNLSNTWSHIAVTRDASNFTRLFVNGTIVGSGTIATNYVQGQTSINRSDTTLGCYISNLRFIKGTALYTSAFTPSTTPLTAISGTSLLTCQSNRFIDNSTNNFTITKFGDTSIQRFSPFSPASVTSASYGAYFDGASDYIRKAGAGVLTASGDVTIECWIYPLTSSVVGLFDGGANEGDIIRNWPANRIGKVGGSNNPTFTVTSNTWQHFACTFSGGNIKVFINGSLNASGTYAGGYSAGSNFDIGTINGGGDGSFNGYISNFRVTKSILYTTTFTPSTTPLTAIADTSLLTLQSTRFIDNSVNNYTLTSVGNSQPSQQNPFGFTSALTNSYSASTTGGSVYIDGTGDYLSVPNNAVFSFGTGDFTVECWTYVTQQTANQYYGLFGKRPSTGSQGWLAINIRNNVAILAFASSQSGAWSSLTAGNLNVPLNAWTHVAVSRSGSNLRVFINGVIDTGASITTSATVVDTTSPFFIGTGTSDAGGEFFQGYISNFRVVKGTAVYTSAFTPPTAPVTAIANTVVLTDFANAGIIDSTMINNIETVGDAKISTTQSKFGGSSIYLDGTGDSLNIFNNPNINLGSGNFTIEMWLYPTGDTQNFSLFAKAGSFELKCDTNRWVWQILPSNNIFVTNGNLAPANTWKHVALVRNGSTTTLYLNGTAYTQGTSADAVTNTNPLTIGSGAGGTFTGYINDFRFTKGLARYTANFTAPTSAFSQK